LEVSTLTYTGGIGLHGRSPLLRLQSDERLVSYVRKGNTAAFEVLVSRYHARLLSFCRHLLGSREDAEDVLQEVFAAAFNAILADDRPINVRPWLYRIARNRSLNHLRRAQALGVDSMDVHLSDNGASTADKVHEREEFRLLVGDIQELPETQRTALVLREMDALSYEQIAEAMETTVSSVKSLLVRARVSLAEASEARLLSCNEVRTELGEVAEGLQRRPSSLVRRHLRSCKRCTIFRGQLRHTNKALTALLPIGPMVLLRKLVLVHLGHLGHLGHSAGAGAGSSATASGAGAAGQAAAVGSTATAAAGATAAVGGAGGFVSAGIGAIATKAAAGLAVAGLVTAGAVEVSQRPAAHSKLAVVPQHHVVAATPQPSPSPQPASPPSFRSAIEPMNVKPKKAPVEAAFATKPAGPPQAPARPAAKPLAKPVDKPVAKTIDKTAVKATAQTVTKPTAPIKPAQTPAPPNGKTQTQTDPTVLRPPAPIARVTPTTTAPPRTADTPTDTTPATTTAPPASTTPTQTPPPTTATTSPASTPAPPAGGNDSGSTGGSPVSSDAPAPSVSAKAASAPRPDRWRRARSW
jgi:RNA polymerase sigma factor (sigma-70 family)